MSIFNVSYDLNEPGQNYEKVHDAIKSFEAWVHLMDSTWLVAGATTENQILKKIDPYLDETDSIFISKVNHIQYAGKLTQEAWDWINEHI